MIIHIKVKPGSKKHELLAQTDGSYIAHLKARPVDGKANQELITLVAEHFGCKKAQVSIKSGAGSKLKRVEIEQ